MGFVYERACNLYCVLYEEENSKHISMHNGFRIISRDILRVKSEFFKKNWKLYSRHRIQAYSNRPWVIMGSTCIQPISRIDFCWLQNQIFEKTVVYAYVKYFRMYRSRNNYFLKTVLGSMWKNNFCPDIHFWWWTGLYYGVNRDLSCSRYKYIC